MLERARPPQLRTWPELPFHDWEDTSATLHMWTQIVGKIRLELSPWINHSWGLTLYVTSRGLTTSPIPYGSRSFAIDFDFLDHTLRITGGLRGVSADRRLVGSPAVVHDLRPRRLL